MKINRPMVSSFILLVIILLTNCATSKNNSVLSNVPLLPAQAQTPSGPVRGVTENGVSIYKGIPYAQPPVGVLRFAPPQDVTPWTEPLDCTEFGAIAVQDTAPPGLTMSEDCLTLNIWTPGLGAHHGSEIVYAFGNLPNGASAEQQTLSDEMFTRWANFIKTGDPNAGEKTPSGVEWPPYSAGDSRMLILDKQITTEEMPGKADIIFMENIMF